MYRFAQSKILASSKTQIILRFVCTRKRTANGSYAERPLMHKLLLPMLPANVSDELPHSSVIMHAVSFHPLRLYPNLHQFDV